MGNVLAGGRIFSGIAKAYTDFIGGFGTPTGVIPGTSADPNIQGPSSARDRIQAIGSRVADLRGMAGDSALEGTPFPGNAVPLGGSPNLSKQENCQRLQGVISALQKTDVVSHGLTLNEISVSAGLRSCFYALETEFKHKRCQDKLKQADNIIGNGKKTYEQRGSKIDELIKELGQKGDCPAVLNILQGSSPGGTSPTLTLRRNNDVNPVPNLRNVLNDYVNVQYHISLSMIPEVESRRLQTRIGRAESRIENESVDDLRQTVRRSGSVTLASTGENERNLSAVVEEPVETTRLEDIDASLYKQGTVKQIQSNLDALAQIYRNNIPNTTSTFGPGVSITGSIGEQFERISGETGRLAFQLKTDRENALIDLVNALQATENVENGARTTRDVSNRNYYAIKDLKVSNVHSPEYHDPFVSNLTAMEMTLQEPHGLNLNEDLVKIANTLGYNDINPGRILYKVDVWFSGYNPKTGDWIQNIAFNDRGVNKKPVVSYYVVMTGVEGNFTTTGTEYKLSFAPQGLMAIRPEEFSLEGMSVPTGGNPTLGSFLKNLSEAISKKRSEETKEELGGIGVRRIYKFYVPDVLREASFYQGEFLERYNMVSEDNKDGSFVTIGKDVDILTLLRSVLSDLPEVQTAFLTNKDNKSFIDPVVHFTVRFNVRYLTKRPEIHDYDGIVYEYIIEPFLSYKKIGFNADTIYQYTNPQSQMQRIQKMLQYGMISRVYDYLNTSENTDVINFDVKLNRFYFETFKRSFDPGARKGIGTSATPSKVTNASTLLGKDRELKVNMEFSSDPALASRFSPDEDSLLQKVFGSGVDNMGAHGNINPSGSGSVSTGYQVIQGSLNTTNDPDSFSSTISDGDTTKTKDEYLQRFNDHFAIDLLTLEGLELRGDPVWLMGPYASSNNNILLPLNAKDLHTNEPVLNILQPHGEKVIFLNIKDVKQFDYMDPERGRRERGRPNIMAGFYGIFGSESTFADGKFTQSLRGYKMAHLNYAGENMIIENLSGMGSRSEFDSIPEGYSTSEWITQVIDQAEKLPSYQDQEAKFKSTAKGFNVASSQNVPQ